MFKDIIETRKRTALLYEAIETVMTMLERAERMFGIVCTCVLTGEETVVDVDQEDRDINAGERLVRRLILQHLTLNPDQDLPTSLALLSVVHDVERVGDYAKNLVELNQWGKLCEGDRPYGQQCREIHQLIQPCFGQILEALREDETEAARQAMRQHEIIKQRTDVFLKTVMEAVDDQREAVLYTLISRYLRRTSAHLSNIASSIVNPFDRISGKEV
jgi:phosphate transport system protein